MTIRSFKIGHLYKTTNLAQDFDVVERGIEQDNPNRWVGTAYTLSNVLPGTPALVIATVSRSWSIALINERTVWLYLGDCEPLT